MAGGAGTATGVVEGFAAAFLHLALLLGGARAHMFELASPWRRAGGVARTLLYAGGHAGTVGAAYRSRAYVRCGPTPLLALAGAVGGPVGAL